MSRLLERREKYLQDCLSSLQDCGDTIKKYVSNNDERKMCVDELRNITKKYCGIDKDYLKSKLALAETEKHINSEEYNSAPNVHDMYNRAFTEQPEVTEERIWNVMEAKLNDYSSGSDTSNALDTSLMCSQITFQIPIDPLTKRPISHPCKNKNCGHVYELASILTYLKSKKNNAKCPYIGCANMNVQKEHIEPDDDLTQRIANSTVRDDSD